MFWPLRTGGHVDYPDRREVHILRDKFVRLLWGLGFEYVTNTSSGQVYWLGGTKLIEVPKVELLEYAWALDSLVRCGFLLSDVIAHLRDTLA